jgi:hypothetical protein
MSRSAGSAACTNAPLDHRFSINRDAGEAMFCGYPADVRDRVRTQPALAVADSDVQSASSLEHGQARFASGHQCRNGAKCRQARDHPGHQDGAFLDVHQIVALAAVIAKGNRASRIVPRRQHRAAARARRYAPQRRHVRLKSVLAQGIAYDCAFPAGVHFSTHVLRDAPAAGMEMAAHRCCAVAAGGRHQLWDVVVREPHALSGKGKSDIARSIAGVGNPVALGAQAANVEFNHRG